MKNSNQYINESVFNVNLKYSKLQNQTKELFFRCLDEGKSYEYFKEKLYKLWGNLDHKFLKDELDEYAEIIHIENMQGRIQTKEILRNDDGELLFFITPLIVFLDKEQKFINTKIKEYINSFKSKMYKIDKKDYLKLKVQRYNNQVVPYYSKQTNKLLRYVQLSTYESMLHNTNLTRTGWNTTFNDADRMGIKMFYIPYHSFSCSHCIEHQNKLYSRDEIIDLVGYAEEAEGDILHPNCKCMLTFYNNTSQFNKPSYSDEELEEQYNIRQKMNSLTLKKEEIATDMRIQNRLGNQDEVDKLNIQRNKINKSIRELKEALPTTELQKQVVAINR